MNGTWLCSRPSLWAGWLQGRNVLCRWPLAVAAAVLSLIGLGAIGRIVMVKHALEAMGDDPLLVVVLSAIVFAAITLRRRRRLAHGRHRDWLAPLPSDLSPTARAALAPLPIWCGAGFLVFVASMAAGLPVSVPAVLTVSTLAGYVVAILIVPLMVAGKVRRERRWLRAGRKLYEPRESAYARVHRVRSGWATNTRLVPLGFWPVAHARFRDRPKKRARGVGFLFLGLPMGVEGAVALAAAAAWLIASHLINLVLGVLRVAFSGSWWLAPTPIGAMRFAVAVSHRAIAGEICICAGLFGAVYAIKGASGLHAALASLVAWISAASLMCVLTCLIAMRTRSIARSVLHQWLR